MASVFILVMFFLSPLVILSSSAEEKKYYPDCQPFPCGHLGPVRFPFNNTTNPECGMFTVNCSENIQRIQLKEGGHWYKIESISQADSIIIDDIVPPFYLSPNPCESIRRFSLPRNSSVFSYNIIQGNISTLFNCSHSLGISIPEDFNQNRCGDYKICYNLQNLTFPYEKQCSTIQLPLQVIEEHPDPHPKGFPPPIRFTFEVHISHDCWNCHQRGGKCGTDSKNQFECSKEQKGIYIRVNEHARI